MKKDIKVYLAAPFFNAEEIRRVSTVEKILEDQGLKVWSPRLNQLKGLEPASKEWREAVFANDVTNIHKADIVVAIYNGKDEGTMWELGYAYANRIPCVVLFEGWESDRMNLMISDSLHAFVGSMTELMLYDFEKMARNRFEGAMI